MGQKHILDGHDAWGPMALAGGLLVLRDSTRMVCVDLRGGK
jgi:outer membrane protein assembly factor BamB